MRGQGCDVGICKLKNKLFNLELRIGRMVSVGDETRAIGSRLSLHIRCLLTRV